MEKKEKKFNKKPYNNDRDMDGGMEKDGDRKGGSWKKRERPPLDLLIDYKDTDTLRPFLSEGGRIVPARVNRLNRNQQKILTVEIKRARQLALVPVSDRHSMVR